MKIGHKLNIAGSILLSLLIFSNFLLFFFPQANNNSSKGEYSENLDELKLSATDWTITEVVSTGSTFISEGATIAVDGAGNVHVAWDEGGSGGDSDIFYKQRDVVSNTWSLTEMVSTESTYTSYSPTIAVDGVGNIHVAWEDLSNYSGASLFWDIFYKRWEVVSSMWTTTEVVSTESTSRSWRPTIAVDGAGNAHVAWQDLTDYSGSELDNDIFYKLWNATTRTWDLTEVVSTESIGQSESPTIAVDGAGNAHVAWHDNTNYDGEGTDLDIFYKLWNATTLMWNPTEVVSTESDDPSTDSTIAVDGAGNAYVAWHDRSNYDGSETDTDIFFKLWNATSSMWTTTEVVSTESIDSSWFPSIAADDTGNVHMVWEDLTEYEGSEEDWDIFYKLWNATSSTLESTVVISTESTAVSWLPTIAVDDSGYAHVAWQDFTNYDSSGGDPDIFYKQLVELPSEPSEPGEQGVPGYNIFLLIGIICVVSVILIKKRNKNKL